MPRDAPFQPPVPLAEPVVVDARGPAEWIVAVPGRGRPLHVYRLGPDDWLVSEVGRASEGRGCDLIQALAALAERATPADWWSAAAQALHRLPGATLV